MADTNKPEKKEKLEPMPPPHLPAGTTFDLSSKELQHADVKFQVPKELAVEKGELGKPPGDLKKPGDLKNEEWMVLANRRSVLCGFNMSGPVPTLCARYPVRYWKVPEGDFMRDETGHSGVGSAVTYTAETATYVKAGFDKVTATASYAFCSASVERSHKEKQAQSSSKKRLYMTGLYRYPRARLFLDACAVVSPKFVEAVEAAVAAKDPAAELNRVLSQFGHAAPNEVVLGGLLVLTYSEEADASSDEHESEERIAAAVDIKFASARGSVSAEHQTATSEKHTSESIAQRTTLETVGGDTLSNPSAWKTTVANPNTWEVIENVGTVSTLELLPADLKQRALRVWLGEHGLGPASDLNLDVVQTAESDGFVFGDVTMMVHGDRGSVALCSDNTRDPKTVRASASCHYWTEHEENEHIQFASFFTPVRRGDSCVLKITPTSGNPSAYAKMQPFDLGFGEWQKLEIGRTYPSADHDGFVVGLIGTTEDGPRGLLHGEQGSQADRLDCWFSSAVHHWPSGHVYIPVQSFCMPVVKSNAFRVRLEPSCGRPYADAYWIPVDGPFKFRQSEARSTNNVYQADTNGIVFGYIYGSGYGPRGKVYLRVADDQTQINEGGPAGETMIHDWEPNRWIKRNSITRAVQKGQFYKAQIQSDNSDVAGVFRWLSIVAG
jgi:hypothetical protein